MQKDIRHEESNLSPEIQDAMKNLISAIRTAKIYPANNPIYSQSIKKSFESLSHFLETSPEYRVGVQNSCFTYRDIPLGKDAQLNKSIAQDLFGKGIREMLFFVEVSESELLELCQTLALSSEELAMRSGIATILWEKGVEHIKVTEAGLDEVITAETRGSRGSTAEGASLGSGEGHAKTKGKSLAGKTLVLADVKTDPEGFAATVTTFAMRSCAENESVEDRLFTLYRQAGKKIQKDHGNESEALFEGLAKSVLALESPYREGLVAGKLYGDLDVELAAVRREHEHDHYFPNALQEIQTGRFSNVWTVSQVAMLLKRSAAKTIETPVVRPEPSQMQSLPITDDLVGMARSLEDNSPEQMEALKTISQSGMESDIIEAAVRTLIALIPLAKAPRRGTASETEIKLFSGIVHQLEDILSYLLKKNNYDLATVIIKALHTPVEPEFQPRLKEALRKTATKSSIKETITDMRKQRKGSAEYQAAYSYLSNLERKATEALLELLSEENDREVRIFLLDLMKDFSRDQIALLGEHLADGRWYVVRNIVSILAENKTDQAIALLRKAADHKNFQIRQEVIKALASTGGKKAAGVLARFLRDQDASIRLMTIQAFAGITGVGPEESKLLVEFLEERRLGRKEQEHTVAAIRALGKIGGEQAAAFLNRYLRIRWWKPRKLQVELRTAAARSINEIMRRQGDGGRAK